MQFLKAPELSNPTKQRQANLVFLLTMTVMVTVSLYGLFVWLFIPAQRDRIPLVVAVLGVSFIVYWLCYKGKFTQASWVYISGMWIVFTVGAFTNGGVRSPGYIAYLVGILLAGVMISLRVAILFSLLSMVSGYFMVVGMQNGAIVGMPPALGVWIPVSLLYFFIVMLTYYATHNINLALVRARAELEERKRAERSLRGSEARYKRLLEEVWDVVYTLSLDGRILSLNPAFEELTGHPVDDWIGKSVLPLFHPEEREIVLARLQLLSTQFPSPPPTTRSIYKKNGETMLIEFASSLVENDGELQIMGIARDVTEKRRVEEALQRAQKLDSLGMMAGGIAHDFNNLLVGMLAQTSLAERILPADSPAQKPIQKAVQAAERAADLTHQLLAYSGQGEFETGPLDINQLIQENLHIFELAIPKHIIIVTDFYDPLPMIVADKGQIQQIVMNLLINAGQAIGEQVGEITISTEVRHSAEDDGTFSQLTGRPLSAGRYVLFQLADNGKGMDEATLTHIFDPFYSTKKDGYGLGLAAVLGIVRGHEGGLCVQSVLGEGTTFKLVFPQIVERVVEDMAVSPPHTSKNDAGIVLIVDDEPHVREAVEDILTMEGLTTLCAENGQGAVELFRQHQDEIVLILLDLSMPGLSGAETLLLLRQQSKEVTIILTSGYAENEIMNGEHQANDFLQKPYNLQQLLAKVQDYL